MLDAGDDRQRWPRFREVPGPGFVEGRIVLPVGQINLGMDDVVDGGAGQRERRYEPLRDDELGLQLDRLAGPLLAFGQQCRRGNAVAMRLVAFRARCDAGNEDEVANGQRRRKARGRPAGEMLVLEMGDFESRRRHDAERLDVHVGARQQQALLRDRGRWRDSARQKFAPHLLIGRHGLDRRVVLVGAYEVGAVGAGRAQHRVDVLPDAKGLLFALGQAGVWGALATARPVRCRS